MAHDPETKARALAMLMAGDAPQYVAEILGVPYTTTKRWQGQAFDRLAEAIGPIDLGLFDFSPKMDTKRKAVGKKSDKTGSQR